MYVFLKASSLNKLTAFPFFDPNNPPEKEKKQQNRTKRAKEKEGNPNKSQKEKSLETKEE